VIAVVGDIHYDSIRKDAPPGAYLAMAQDDSHKPSYTAIVRSDGPPAKLGAAARSLAAQMSPDIPPPVMISLSEQLDESISS
jgi:hypothetical protein